MTPLATVLSLHPVCQADGYWHSSSSELWGRYGNVVGLQPVFQLRFDQRMDAESVMRALRVVVVSIGEKDGDEDGDGAKSNELREVVRVPWPDDKKKKKKTKR